VSAVQGCAAILPPVGRTASVKVECLLRRDGFLGVILAECLGHLLLGHIEVGHVSVVVLLVMRLHNVRRDRRLEGLFQDAEQFRAPYFSPAC
jgi:hypothetical protein